MDRGCLDLFPQFGEGKETARTSCLAWPVKKICPKCMILVTSGVIWGDLGTFWSDFGVKILQNRSV